ncbi:MAG: manganese efflux pump [Alistipes indistinctus]
MKVHLYDGSPLGNILLVAALIGTAAFSISATGILIGKHVSSKLGSKAEIFGGAILILIGLKVLYDHLL